MRLFHAFIIAFSTYSRIPMPQIPWREEDMRYSMGFFPMIGVVIGAAVWGWIYLARQLQLGAFLTGAVAAVLPLLLCGGIHMDGFMDTLDALASNQPPARKLEILKDSHVGAFAAMGVGVYLLVYAGILGEISPRVAGVIGCGFVLSRAMSAMALIHFHPARPDGMLAAFAQSTARRGVTYLLIGWIGAALIGMAAFDLRAGALSALGMGLVFLYYHRMSMRQFGGVTGDLAGYFLTLAELAMAAMAMIGGIIGGV